MTETPSSGLGANESVVQLRNNLLHVLAVGNVCIHHELVAGSIDLDADVVGKAGRENGLNGIDFDIFQTENLGHIRAEVLPHHHVVVGGQHGLLTQFGNVIKIADENDILAFNGANVIQNQCTEDQIQRLAAWHGSMGDNREFFGSDVAHGENGLPGEFANSVENVFDRLIDNLHRRDFIVRQFHPAGRGDQHGRRGFTGDFRLGLLGVSGSGARQGGQRGGESEGWQSEVDIHGWC